MALKKKLDKVALRTSIGGGNTRTVEQLRNEVNAWIRDAHIQITRLHEAVAEMQADNESKLDS